VATIRPLEPDDLPGVAELVRVNLAGWSRDEAGLARLLVDHPWAETPLRSLVALDDSGELIGSIGAQTRRVRFGDRELKGVAVSHLVVAPDRRAGAAGVMLVRQLLGGGQDLTWTDSGTPAVLRIWGALGGRLDHSRVCNWMIVLRRGRWLRARLAARISRSRSNAHLDVPVRALPFDSATVEAEVDGEDVSGGALPDIDEAVSSGFELRVAHDAAYLERQFEFLTSIGERVVSRVVRRGERPLGWYAYLLRPTASRVLAIAAPAMQADAVLGDLLRDARDRGTSVVSGRLEPHLDQALRGQPAVLALSQQPIIHAREPEVLAALTSSSSLLTELDLIDSEYW
jgi:hypothetical protein